MLTIAVGHTLAAPRDALGDTTELSAVIANRRHEARALIYACMAYDRREKTRTAPSFDESAELHRLIAAIGSGRLPSPDRFSGVAGEKQYEELYDNRLIALFQRCCGTANIDHGTTAQSERDPGRYLG